MRLLITGCSDPLRWYAPLVGQVVPMLGDVGNEYRSREPGGAVNFVQYADARLIADDADPALEALAELADTLAAEVVMHRDAAAKALRAALVCERGAAELRQTLARFERQHDENNDGPARTDRFADSAP